MVSAPPPRASPEHVCCNTFFCSTVNFLLELANVEEEQAPRELKTCPLSKVHILAASSKAFSLQFYDKTSKHIFIHIREIDFGRRGHLIKEYPFTNITLVTHTERVTGMHLLPTLHPVFEKVRN